MMKMLHREMTTRRRKERTTKRRMKRRRRTSAERFLKMDLLKMEMLKMLSRIRANFAMTFKKRRKRRKI